MASRPDEAIVEDLDSVQHWTAAIARRSEYVEFVGRSAVEPVIDRLAYLLLRRLADVGDCSLTELVNEFDVSPPTITRHIARLEGEGRVARGRDSGNHRVVVATITDKGRRDLTAVIGRRYEVFDEMLKDWDPDDKRALGTYLERFFAVLSAERETPRDR